MNTNSESNKNNTGETKSFEIFSRQEQVKQTPVVPPVKPKEKK